MRSPERSPSDQQERRSDAIVAFLGAGLAVSPSTALMVTTLADARRSIKASQAQSQPIDDWLAREVRLGGIRENAAVLAALEILERQVEIAEAVRRRHPDRQQQLSELIAVIGQQPPATQDGGTA